MEILLGIGIFVLIMGLVIWRLRVAQEQKDNEAWLAAMSQRSGEPWPWPKGDDR
jgi:hypothetical protein